jgi:outer membrane lipoprotein-sorting protein
MSQENIELIDKRLEAMWDIPIPSDVDEHLRRQLATFRAKLAEVDPRSSQLRQFWNNRIAWGLSVSAVAIAALFFAVLDPTSRLSAMEQLAKELQQVQSYSYEVHSTNQFVDDDGHRIKVTERGQSCWQAPHAFRNETTITKEPDDNSTPVAETETLEHFVEAFPPEGDGVFIDFKRHTYRRLPWEPIGSDVYPLDMLRMIREGSGKVTKDLGSRQVQGKKANGFMMELKGAHEDRKYPPMDIWIDAETKLPLEFGYEVNDALAKSHTKLRVSDFRWNPQIDAATFKPTPPEGFMDTTPPTDKKSLDEMTSALRLYADLSGGHYPKPKSDEFDPLTIQQEMLHMAGFIGAEKKDEWASDPKFQRINASLGGLKSIQRILRNIYRAEYRGADVAPTDNDKVLLWWTDWAPERYTVVFSDLRSEQITPEKAAELKLRRDQKP